MGPVHSKHSVDANYYDYQDPQSTGDCAREDQRLLPNLPNDLCTRHSLVAEELTPLLLVKREQNNIPADFQLHNFLAHAQTLLLKARSCLSEGPGALILTLHERRWRTPPSSYPRNPELALFMAAHQHSMRRKPTLGRGAVFVLGNCPPHPAVPWDRPGWISKPRGKRRYPETEKQPL